MTIRLCDKVGVCGWSERLSSFADQVPCIERRSGGNESEDDGSGMVETELLVTANASFESACEFGESKIWLGNDITSIAFIIQQTAR